MKIGIKTNSIMKQIKFKIEQSRAYTPKEKHIRINRLKPTILIFSAVLSFFMILGSTFAWFISEDTVVNKLSAREDVRDFTVVVIDEFDPDEPRQPGEVIAKKVGAYNTGGIDAFVRIMAIPAIIASDGVTSLPAEFGREVIANFNGNDWINGNDGYFYYKHILPKHTSTDKTVPPQNLFETFKISEYLDERYDNARLNIEVRIEACVTEPNNEFIAAWWDGVIPTSGPLYDVLTALQNAVRS